MSNDAAARVTPARLSSMAAAPVASSRLRYTGLGTDEVRFTGGYWRALQDLNAGVILRHCEDWMSRVGWIANFDFAAAGTAARNRRGIDFVDSEIYKLLEAMAWELGRHHDSDLDSRFSQLVERVASAQQPDGYLNTNFGGPGQAPRYSDMSDGHELYCAGHLIQAAVARIRTGHDDLLVETARRLADHIYREFGPSGRPEICGHPEVETALVEFSRATADARYLELARLFIERRGHGLLNTQAHSDVYYLDDVPVRSATVLRGHAVRALYLAAGAFDVGVETGDDELMAAVSTQLVNTNHARTYLTGGVGARHEDESFGLDYELPNDRAYAETCAGVASVMLNWRMLLATGDEVHADQLERVLLNNVLASPRADGHAFFYANTLHMREPAVELDDDTLQVRAESGMRAPWFSVSCCPTNVARTVASAAGYVATRDSAGVQLHQYGEFELSTVLDDGTPIDLTVRSGYPFDGDVSITIGGGNDVEFTLGLRVPGWARRATLEQDGTTTPVEPGRADVRRVFAPGEVILLHLPTEPEFAWPHANIDADRGQVAVLRGPLVLALESVDLPDGVEFDQLSIDPSVAPRRTEQGAVASFRPTRDERLAGPLPYFDVDGSSDSLSALDIPLVPYSSWANRGPSRMRVWIPHTIPDSPSSNPGDGDPTREHKRAANHPIQTKMSNAPREETQ